jgi:hypothetical protein
MLNALTIDVEDYYHVSAFEAVVPFADWERYESRVEKNTHRTRQKPRSLCWAGSWNGIPD